MESMQQSLPALTDSSTIDNETISKTNGAKGQTGNSGSIVVVGGEAVHIDSLGPIIINTDGTVSRITNWMEMSDIEKNRALRMVSKRNKKRRTAATDAADTTVKDREHVHRVIDGIGNVFIRLAEPSKDLQHSGAICDMVNAAYSWGEQGMWNDGFQRTTKAEVEYLIKNNNLLLVLCPNESGGGKDFLVAGSACVRRLKEDSVGVVGMLAVQKKYLKKGLGKMLMDAAENWARSLAFEAIQLELLTPRGWDHPQKVLLKAWYTKIGFEEERREDFS
eukprot:UC4_evm1s485